MISHIGEIGRSCQPGIATDPALGIAIPTWPKVRDSEGVGRQPAVDEAAVVRLIITPATTPGSFTASLDGEPVVTSRQPLADGARKLLALGFDSATPLTMHHAGNAYDSFEPKPIGEWAKVIYTERDQGGLSREPWKARPDAVSRSAGRVKEENSRRAATQLPAGGLEQIMPGVSTCERVECRSSSARAADRLPAVDSPEDVMNFINLGRKVHA